MVGDTRGHTASCVIVCPVLGDLVFVVEHPQGHRDQRLKKRPTQLRNDVVDMSGHTYPNLSRNEAVALELSQRHREHSSRYSGNVFEQIGKSLRLACQMRDGQHGPLIGDAIQDAQGKFPFGPPKHGAHVIATLVIDRHDSYFTQPE